MMFCEVRDVDMKFNSQREIVCCDPESYGRVFIYDASDIFIECAEKSPVFAIPLILAFFSLMRILGFLLFLAICAPGLLLLLKRSSKTKEEKIKNVIYDENAAILGDITCMEITLLLKLLDDLSIAPDTAIRILANAPHRRIIVGCLDKIKGIDADLYHHIHGILSDVFSFMNIKTLEKKYMQTENLRRTLNALYIVSIYVLLAIALGATLWNVLLGPTEASLSIFFAAIFASLLLILYIACFPIAYYLMLRGLQEHVDMRLIRSRSFRRRVIETTKRLIILVATQAEKPLALDLKRLYRLKRYARRPKFRQHPEFTILWGF